ncbi:hypothetical protein HOY80DRAFT_1058851 [Tuber brumale]|nr:hypothetical protein HOY80DRAFT_1058851 [Tuber brumale]
MNGVTIENKDAEEQFLEQSIFAEPEIYEEGLSEVDGGDSDDNGKGGIALVGNGEGIKMRELTYRCFQTSTYSWSADANLKYITEARRPKSLIGEFVAEGSPR